MAFIDLNEKICGIEIRQMRPLHLAMLDAARNPFLSEEVDIEPGEAMPHLVIFLWALSSEFQPGECSAKSNFIKRCRKLKYQEAVDAIRKYIEDTFQDSPPECKAGASYTSWVASIVDLLASEYGWNEEAIFQIPMKRIFQYVRRIEIRNGSKMMFNKSDKIKGRFLQEMADRNQRMNEYIESLNQPYSWNI